MIDFVSIIAIGFFLGMRHATDPDHVVAVTTIVSRQRNLAKAALTGIFWGVGHTLTIFVVGSLIILFDVVIPARIGLSMEFSVGLMLIALGAWNIFAFLRSSQAIASWHGDEDEAGFDPAVTHNHPHAHGALVHTHVHERGSHADGSDAHAHRSPQSLPWMDRMFGRIGLYRQLRPLLIGIVHGLAGSAAVALLILATIRNPRWAMVYLLVFGLGTVGGMMLITMSIASAFRFFGQRNRLFSHWLGFASGLVSLLFGMFLVWQIGFANGLFSAHPQWTPR
jgi:high-affinity nickel-transport protein